MSNERVQTEEEILTIGDFQNEFLSLRVGEEIPILRVAKIRKVVNRLKDDNLSSVDYKYLIESKEKKILKVNSWAFWKKISSVIREAGKIEVDLELKHPAFEDYRVRVI